MGLRQEPLPPPSNEPDPQQQKQEEPSSASSSTRPSLPPEALELATKLFSLSREGSTPALQQYLEAGIPANLTNHKGDTLLMLAAYHGHLETVRMLVEKGADVNALNDRGQNIVAGTVFKGYDEIARFLVGKGADTRAGQPSAVETARMFRRVELLRDFGEEE